MAYFFLIVQLILKSRKDDVTTVPQSPGFERLLRPFWSECVRFLVDSFHRLS